MFVNSKLVSSTKWCILQFLTELCMSFMYRINKGGPRAELCGTPWDIVLVMIRSLWFEYIVVFDKENIETIYIESYGLRYQMLFVD